VTFDHRATKFPLAGKHAQTRCDACHTQNVFHTTTGTSCVSCHRPDDVHRGRYGDSCDKCHSPEGWKTVRFQHDRDTRFPLKDAHAALKCEACHREARADLKLSTSCGSCHQADDVHRGQEGDKCGRCHTAVSWKENIRFDHDLTAFPLIGVHAVAACDQCHATRTFKDAETGCVSCHAADDFHKKSLGTDCARCHNPNGWKLWTFDHDTQTGFRLEGGHQGLQCSACHRKPAGDRPRLSTACVSCHEKEDVHSGRFGESCDRCHVAESFKKVVMTQ
jgi:hypothetical protein